MESELTPEVETYISAYSRVKECFDKYAFVVDNTASPVCDHCSDIFEESQQIFKRQIMENKTNYKAFTEVCLDVADRYNELNHIYEKFLCSANANTTPEQGFQFGFAAGFILIIAIFYSPTFSSYRVKLDVKWNNAVYVVTQNSENAHGRKIR